MAELCRLTDQGLKAFVQYLQDGAQGAPPLAQLSTPPFSQQHEPMLDVEQKSFRNRFELGVYLCEVLKKADRTRIAQDAGVWNWLALFFFDEICPVRADGSRRVLSREKYIFDPRARRFYRHLVAAPFLLVQRHGESARTLLDSKVSQHGDFTEQIVSRQEIITNHELLKAIYALYFDANAANGGHTKRGATDRDQPGTVRRLAAVLQQFALTYDMQAMAADEILSLLPEEFTPWKPKEVTQAAAS